MKKTLIKKINNVLYSILKKVFDIIVGIIGIIILIPVSIVVKVFTLLNRDFNSIFFVQIRIGKNGKKFKLYKFRTMVPNAEEELQKLLKIKKYKTEWDKNQKFKNDPRITKIGKILRKTSIDELPQFINILKGDMSLIGPRPLIEGELLKHKGNPSIYQSIKPGITGWWVCNGREEMTYKKRLNLEYYYVENRGILLDIKCIFKTIKIILKGNV